MFRSTLSALTAVLIFSASTAFAGDILTVDFTGGRPVIVAGNNTSLPHARWRNTNWGDPPVLKVAPAWAPPAETTPRLGFQGQMHYGWGMMVLSVNDGTLASQLGLESGDVIEKINDVTIQSPQHYTTLLQHAMNYHGGSVKLLVNNVRWRNGTAPNKYVQLIGNLQGGSSGPIAASQAHPTTVSN